MTNLSWREERYPEIRLYSSTITFGGPRDAGIGYMSYSDRVGPGVVVLHEFFGLQPAFTAFADALCRDGFTALAPDLYNGDVYDTVEQARAAASALDPDTTMRRVRAGAEHLRANWHPRVGAVGFSLGADFAAALACEGAVDATVLYYGVPDTQGWRTPALGHYAQADDRAPPEESRRAFAAIAAAGNEAEMHVYPAVGHWFVNPGVVDAFAPEAAELAHARTFDFLHHHLS